MATSSSSAAASSSITTILGDDLLLQIFLRIDSPVTLVRASAACKPWRRLITHPSFLLDFHQRHPSTPLLGLFFDRSGSRLNSDLPVFIPSPQPDPELASAVSRGDFSFSLLGRDSWQIRDHLDTVLLFTTQRNDDNWRRRCDPPEQIAAYDPFSLCCLVFGPPPTSFFDGTHFTPLFHGCHLIAGKEGTSQWFRVVCIIRLDFKVRAAVFSSDTKDWCICPWSEMLPIWDPGLPLRMHGKDSLYWPFPNQAYMLALDTRTMQFSTIVTMIGETEDGELCFVDLRTNGFMLLVWIRGNEEGDGGAERWVLKKEVSFQDEICRIIPEHDEEQVRLTIIDVRKGYVYLTAWDMYHGSSWLLSFRLKTMQLGKAAEQIVDFGYVCRVDFGYVYPYTINWPPSFRSLPEKQLPNL